MKGPNIHYSVSSTINREGLPPPPHAKAWFMLLHWIYGVPMVQPPCKCVPYTAAYRAPPHKCNCTLQGCGLQRLWLVCLVDLRLLLCIPRFFLYSTHFLITAWTWIRFKWDWLKKSTNIKIGRWQQLRAVTSDQCCIIKQPQKLDQTMIFKGQTAKGAQANWDEHERKTQENKVTKKIIITIRAGWYG